VELDGTAFSATQRTLMMSYPEGMKFVLAFAYLLEQNRDRSSFWKDVGRMNALGDGEESKSYGEEHSAESFAERDDLFSRETSSEKFKIRSFT
jgi:hypothetical protein